MRTLYRGAVVCSPAHPTADALLVQDDRIAWLGDTADAPRADRVVDLEGGVVTAAFVDAHVHLTDVGLALMGLDLSRVRSSGQLLDRLACHAATLPRDAVVLGSGWDETTWPDAQVPSAGDLDRAAGGRAVYLSRVDAHSALASAALLAAVPAAVAGPGYDPRGWLRGEAHHAVRVVALGSVSLRQRLVAQQTALRRAASLGIASLHECGGPDVSDEEDFTGLLTMADPAVYPEVFGFWGELGAAAKAREMGAVGAGGDLFVDGALGSRTALLRTPYTDGAGCGTAYVDVGQIVDHVVECVEHGLQSGFHAIGDGALALVTEGYTRAADLVGRERLRAGSHRVEHAELLDRDMIAAMVDCGLVASVQPVFDRMWGGPTGMYAARLGADRALASNPLADLVGVGVGVAFGSDAPVTPLDPWGAVVAAVRMHNPRNRVDVRVAFAAHTRGGWRAVGRRDEGLLVPGAAATFAVWDAPGGVAEGLPRVVSSLPDEEDPPLPVCRRTVSRGSVIFDDGSGG